MSELNKRNKSLFYLRLSVFIRVPFQNLGDIHLFAEGVLDKRRSL